MRTIHQVSDIGDLKLASILSNVLTGASKTSALLTELEISSTYFPSVFGFKHIRYYSKMLTPVMERLLESDSGYDTFGYTIGVENDERWYRLLKAFYTQYNLLNEYSETEEFDGSDSTEGSSSESSKSETESESHIKSGYYGFNSIAAAPMSESDSDSSSSTSGGKADNEKEYEDSVTKEHTLTRAGNRTAPAELLLQELRARLNNILDMIYTDIAHYICLEIY